MSLAIRGNDLFSISQLMGNKNYNFLAGQKIGRIEALSDGVFAIAITLLVLDIHVPKPVGSEEFKTEFELMNAFVRLLPDLLPYFLGFMTLGIFWVGQSTQFKFINKPDRHLTWMSIFFLMFVSLIPFSTRFLSEYIGFKFAVGIYWLNIFLAGIMLLIQWSYAHRTKLIDIESGNVIYATIRNRIVFAQTLYAIAALCCFINTYLSVALTILIQLNYALAFFFSSGRPHGESEETGEETE